jgi:hypothetical protein
MAIDNESFELLSNPAQQGGKAPAAAATVN